MAVIEAVNRKTREDLEILRNKRILRGFYLAGGTGLALLLNHRESRDLDFFRPTAFDERQLVERLRRAGSFSLEKRETGTVRGRFRNTLVSFFYYPYRLLQKPKTIAGVSVASLRDIACMKLDAISSRGTRRDFIDVYTIIKKGGLSVSSLLKSFSRKYAPLRYNLMHVKKSLVYFADADEDPMPKMLTPADWKDIKRFFVAEMKQLHDISRLREN